MRGISTITAPLGTRGHGRRAHQGGHLLGARYQRRRPRLGTKKALVALEHSILTAVWHMLTDDVGYHDLGGDYFTKRDPERAIRRLVRQANALGAHRPLRPHPGRISATAGNRPGLR